MESAPSNDGTYHGMDDQDGCGSSLGFDFCSLDYNDDSSSIYSSGKVELVYNKNGSLTLVLSAEDALETKKRKSLIPIRNNALSLS